MLPKLNFSITLLVLLISLSHAQKTCPRGSFLSNATSSCELCPPGFYQSNPSTNATSCQPCPAGTFFPFKGGQQVEVCRSCYEGNISQPGSATCTDCEPGTVENFDRSRCVTCPPGTEVDSFNGDQDACSKCRPGTYNPVQNGKCVPCPSGQISGSGSSSVSQCESCPEGQAPSGDQCGECDSQFQVYDPETRTCDSPEAGTVIENGKASLCKPGEFGSIPDAEIGFTRTICEKCPEGTTTFSAGQTFCRAIGFKCPPNYAELPSGDCKSCAQSERFDKTSGTCMPCPRGFASRGGNDETCTKCETLLVEGFRASFCFDLENFNVRVDGNCPPGTKTSMKYPLLCEECTANTFSAEVNSTECTPCQLDEIQQSRMATSCEPCPAGALRLREYDTECLVPQTKCQPGEELIGEFLACGEKCDEPRPKGINHSGCFKCSPGSEPDPENNGECRFCEGVTVSDGRKCGPCPNGEVGFGESRSCSCADFLAMNRGIIDGECKICPPGSYGKSADGSPTSPNTCVKCPAGLVRKITDEAEILSTAMSRFGGVIKPCVPCPPGFITTTDGASECEKCPTGTTSYGLGETECVGMIGSGLGMIDIAESSAEAILAETSEGTPEESMEASMNEVSDVLDMPKTSEEM